MPSASIRVSILIDAAPESVFAYVSDLTCHAERREIQFQANLLQWLTPLLVVNPSGAHCNCSSNRLSFTPGCEKTGTDSKGGIDANLR